jgi:GTP-binding protein
MNQQQVLVRHAEFLFGAPRLEAIRPQKLPEVAIVGRSNVGKSTFINRLAGRKLARVSGNPGSTRELNFYRIDLTTHNDPWSMCLVDMPGFGFAKLSKVAREEISELVVLFLNARKHLRGVILLNDSRRQPADDELAVQRLCATLGIPCVIVLTKFDTLRQKERSERPESIATAYHLEAGDLLHTGEGISAADVWERIRAIL